MTESRRRRDLEQQIVDSSKTEPETVKEVVGPDPSKITADRLIPSGVTMINCGCSDNPFGAFAFGSIVTIPGESASGKTELMLTMLASCAMDKRLQDYDLVLDDAEYSQAFDLAYLFPPLVGRLKPPKYGKDKSESIYSETVQDFEANILTFSKGKRPFIYVLDSLDSLSSTEELEREWKNALKMAKNADAVKELNKSYGTEKARIIGQVLRMINSRIKNSDSVLFIVQQTRQNMNPGFGQPDWTTSGGNAPFFYSFHRLYLKTGKSITEEAKNIKHQIGAHTYCQIVKNKLNGKRRKAGIEFDIYEDLGIDDVASCVDFLKTTDHWRVEDGYMFAPEILGKDRKMYRKHLIEHIEKEDAVSELRRIVGRIWNEIEDEIRVKGRKRRF